MSGIILKDTLMKIALSNYDPNKTGGGWTFSNSFVKAMGDNIVPYEEAEIYFIPSPTLATHSEVEKAKQDGKKIVLRLDNAVRDSRNRGTGMSRMKAFSAISDLVIYQSKWAREFLYPFTKKDGAVILNGVDKAVYNGDNRLAEDDTYLYVRSSRDEGKQWIMAWYWFVNKAGRLEIVGRFSSENLEYNFDFYNNEKYIFMGEQRNMPDVYRRNKYFLYTYLNDACSNTLLEARASGCQIIDCYGMLQTGGAPEIMNCEDISLGRMIEEYEVELERI